MSKRPLRWRIGDALDEFAHRRLRFGMVTSSRGRTVRWYWRLTPLPWLCNRRELSYGVPGMVVYGGGQTTANTNAYLLDALTAWHYKWHDQAPREDQ